MTKREKKRTKRKWLRNLFIIFTIFILSVGAYSIIQYYKGLSVAMDDSYIKDETTFEPFEGPEPQFGEINVLLIGSDSRADDRGNSDTIMIAHYNQNTHDMKIVSLMRDIYVDIPEHGKYKLNAAYAFGGPELLRKTIKQNFDIDINYYAVVGFEGFPKIVDLIAPNGIEVDIENEMKYGIGMTLHPGKQVLHGKELLGYVRFRHDRLSDFGRVGRQQEVMSKLKEQAVSIHSLVNLPKILGMAEPYINTNVDASTLLAVGKGLIVGNSKQMETFRIPLQDTFENKSVDVGAVLSIDFEKNTQALKDFLSSDDASSEEVAVHE
ncbi:LCP family protein [Bacillus sp. FJAT-49732]|uniref:Regulatory protein MsrR n=1 Tax=Lederbergia citrisecunda TaxID=2833583 RepID=A0A942TLB9_9BACI|nr:LCP family protein [Lederbergia citrisecunda]